MNRLILATRNAHKTREFAEILGVTFTISDLTSGFDVPEVEETGATFQENAALKAAAASRRLAGLVVADDSGLEVAALDGAPGVRSARYAGETASDEENVARLLAALEATTDPLQRRAHFRCVLALAHDGEVTQLFHGQVGGVISDRPRGSGGFGYDPVFIPDGLAQTFAELPRQIKNRLSHRARAIQKLAVYLRAPG